MDVQTIQEMKNEKVSFMKIHLNSIFYDFLGKDDTKKNSFIYL